MQANTTLCHQQPSTLTDQSLTVREYGAYKDHTKYYTQTRVVSQAT